MITPHFQLQQNEDFVVIVLRVKYIRASTADWYALDHEFKFHCHPYFLRLHFPSRVLEDGRERASYDPEKGEFTVYLPKANRGEYFPDLDMITSLLGASNEEKKPRHPLIEVLEGTKSASAIETVHIAQEDNSDDDLDVDMKDVFDTDAQNEAKIDDNEFNWSLPQIAASEPSNVSSVLLNKRFYGFADKYSSFFERDPESIREICENPSPDSLDDREVKEKRIQKENDDFDEDVFWNDSLRPDEELSDVINFVTPFRARLNEINIDSVPETMEGEEKIIEEITQIRSLTRVNDEKPIQNHAFLEFSGPVIEKIESKDGSSDLKARNEEKSTKKLIQIVEDIKESDMNIDEIDEKELPPLEFVDPISQKAIKSDEKSEEKPRIMIEKIHSYDNNEEIDWDFRGKSGSQMLLESFDVQNWSEQEREQLLRLPRREYVLDKPLKKRVFCSMIDILFASCYDMRATKGEGTVESNWTVSKVSATLSWLDKFDSVRSALLACMRRAVIYPLYRSWAFSKAVASDVCDVLLLGKRASLKVLLYARKALEWSDSVHAMNRLYLDDYCVWIQTVPRTQLRQLALHLREIVEKLTLADFALDLEEDEMDTAS